MKTVNRARDAADLASDVVNLARDVTIPAMETVNRARYVADLATEATKAAERGPSLTLMTWNASHLLSSGRKLALLHLLTSSDVDVATVTECEIPETVKDFAVAGYTTSFPKVPEGKSKTRVITLVKNDLVASANVHL
jgi:methyl coenzyme M reductase subunit C